MKPILPFSDLVIVEFATVLAGPRVGTFFAEQGARVIKIEPYPDGDITRSWRVPEESGSDQASAYFSAINYGKEHLFLNLKDDHDLKRAHELVEKADVVISNFRSGQSEKFGLAYHQLSTKRAELILGQISGFGPGSDRPAYDVVLQAETGYLSMSGPLNGEAVKMPVALIDIIAAHQLQEGILVALLEKGKTGLGSLVEVSLYDAAIASLANQASNWLMAGHLPQRMGCLHPNIAPYGEVFNTLDMQEMVLAVGSDLQFKALCKVLELESIPSDHRFVNNSARVLNRSDLQIKLQEKIGQWKYNSLSDQLFHHGVPFGKIKNLEEVFSDPSAQKLVIQESSPKGNSTRRVRSSIFQIKINGRKTLEE